MLEQKDSPKSLRVHVKLEAKSIQPPLAFSRLPQMPLILIYQLFLMGVWGRGVSSLAPKLTCACLYTGSPGR